MSHRKGKRRRREEQEATIRFSTRTTAREGGAPDPRFHWFDDSPAGWSADMPWPRRDYFSTRKWKSQPVPPGEHPYRVGPDGVVDLHPSQWSVR